MNKRALALYGITEKDYKLWCKNNNKSHYKKSVKAEFFNKIQKNEIIKDSNGILINNINE